MKLITQHLFFDKDLPKNPSSFWKKSSLPNKQNVLKSENLLIKGILIKTTRNNFASN